MRTLLFLGAALFSGVAGCGGDPGPSDGSAGSDAPGSVGVDAPFTPPDAGTGPCAAGPLAAPIPGCAPAVLPSTGDPAQDCVNRINQFRWECQCMGPLGRWSAGEACASMDAEYDSTRTPHAGFTAGICNSGFAQNECPGWPSIPATIDGCLQQMWDEGPGPFATHGHYINMTNPMYTEVACGFYTTPGGQVWAVQNFR